MPCSEKIVGSHTYYRTSMIKKKKSNRQFDDRVYWNGHVKVRQIQILCHNFSPPMYGLINSYDINKYGGGRMLPPLQEFHFLYVTHPTWMRHKSQIFKIESSIYSCIHHKEPTQKILWKKIENWLRYQTFCSKNWYRNIKKPRMPEIL